MKKAAISACLLGRSCRYDGRENHDARLLEALEGYELIPFCPEDFCYGTPRPTMDLVQTAQGIKAISNLTHADLSAPLVAYAEAFFDTHDGIDLFIGKDRSPSCGVCSARVYDAQKTLISESGTGLMAAAAKSREIPCYDAEHYGINPQEGTQ